VWDLRTTPPDSLEHAFPISAIPHRTPMVPQGALVPPGTYTVRLTAGGNTLTQPLVVKLDPRLKVTQQALDTQFALLQQVTARMHDTFLAAKQAQSLQEQIDAAKKAGNPNASLDAFATKVKTLASGGQGGGFTADPLRNLEEANGALATLLSSIDSADAGPTQQQTQVAQDALQKSAALVTQWKQLLSTELPKVNTGGVQLDPNKPLSGPVQSSSSEDEE
jgi:hypothetical protein